MRDEDEPTSDAAQAFEELRAEVAVLRRAVESLPAEWEGNQPPDYTESLGEITQGLSKVVARLQGIEQHPALRFTPAQYQAAILAAGRDLMSQAVGRLDRATDVFVREQQNLTAVIGTVRGQRQQWEWLGITAAAALVAGLLLSPVAAGLLPFGLDGRVAAFILHADRWNAGGALMQAQNPEAWRVLQDAGRLTTANAEALAVCRQEAAKAKKEQHCSIVVAAP